MLSVQPYSFRKLNYPAPAKSNVSFGESAVQVAGEVKAAMPIISRALKVNFTPSDPYAMAKAVREQLPRLDDATIRKVVSDIDAMYH